MISQVARKYAKALFQESLEKGNLSLILKEGREIHSSIESDQEVVSFLKSPLISSEHKVQVLKQVFEGKISSDSLNFLILLVDKKRINFMEQIFLALENLEDQANDVVRGNVISASDLIENEKKELIEIFSKKLKKTVIFTYQIDPSLLGGTFIQIGGRTFDDTIRYHLRKLKDDINRRSN